MTSLNRYENFYLTKVISYNGEHERYELLEVDGVEVLEQDLSLLIIVDEELNKLVQTKGEKVLQYLNTNNVETLGGYGDYGEHCFYFENEGEEQKIKLACG